MKVAKISNFIPNDENIESYRRDADADLVNLVNFTQGRVRFGTATNGYRGENISGKFVQYTSNGTKDTEDTISHNLGVIPQGYIVIWQDKAGNVYQGPTTGTAWTSSNLYLKCSVASVTFMLFVLK